MISQSKYSFKKKKNSVSLGLKTALSKHFRKLKNKGLTPEIQWSILKRSNTTNCFDSRCNLCREEKIQIVLNPDSDKLSNQRCDLMARCRNRNKFKL